MSVYLLATGWVVLTLLVVTLTAAGAKRRGPHVLIGIYVGLIVASVIVATKLIVLFGTIVPAGVIVYSSSFLITDLISERYGKRDAQTAVYTGFAAMMLYTLYAFITVNWSWPEYWPNQEAYKTIVSLSWRIALAGGGAFIVSQLMDVFIFHLLKGRHGDKHLWIRNIVSTCISQLIDTIIFISIAFYGIFPITPLVLGQYAIKLGIAIVDTPFFYLGVWILSPPADNDEEVEAS